MKNYIVKRILFRTILLIVILAAAITAILTIKERRDREKAALDVGKVGELTVLPDTQVKILKHYSCGHMEMTSDKNYIGFTKKMLSEIENCYVLKMSKEEVCLLFDYNEYCQNHYLLIVTGKNILGVFKTTKKKQWITDVAINTDNINEAEMLRLKNGIYFDSLNDVNCYLEGVET